ncbi:MAG: hypothetical protein L6R36_003212 [Xanthoria steineri]|nr:MAG: hypothetical protein L6R36_003212 [Xanthoria steineri]
MPKIAVWRGGSIRAIETSGSQFNSRDWNVRCLPEPAVIFCLLDRGRRFEPPYNHFFLDAFSEFFAAKMWALE